MSEAGYVYLVSHPNGRGNHKIGLTRNPPERIKQLGGPACRVHAMVLCTDPEHIEGLLHKRFARNRVPQSEWFDLNRQELQEICDVLFTAYVEATQHVVIPTLPPEPTPEPIPVITPTPPPIPDPSPIPEWKEEPSRKQTMSEFGIWNYRANDWEEVTPSKNAGWRKVVFIPGRGYCVLKGS